MIPPRPRIDVIYVGPGLSGRQTSMNVVNSCLREATALEQTYDPVRGLRMCAFSAPADELDIGVRGTTGALAQSQSVDEMCRQADAIVLVLDSQPERLEANGHHAKHLFKIVARSKPIVLQLNKRDLKRKSSIAEMSRAVNRWSAPELESVAPRGIGVWEAFVTAAMLGARARDLEAIAARVLTRSPSPATRRSR